MKVIFDKNNIEFRSKLNFIKDEIIREGSKKRTCFTSTLLKNHNNKTVSKEKGYS